MSRCSSCGAENDDAAVFCANCNHFLEWEVPVSRGRRGASEPSPGRDPTAPDASAAPSRPPVPHPPQPDPISESESISGPSAKSELEPESESIVEPGPVPAPERWPEPVGEPELVSAPELEAKPQPAAPRLSAHDIINAIDAGCDLATEDDRPDLTEHLGQARDRLVASRATVVVLGEFKRGKSTLINALLRTAVCPVDADVVTAVPTIVSYADTAGVTAYAQDPESREIVTRETTLRDLTRLVSEPADPDAPMLERSVEVRIPHRMLRAGLRLIDTPGIGGLDSAHGYLALGTLAMADGAIFVTDASQELTAPELAFLKTVVKRCPATALVVTKTDLHAEWRRIVELDRRHLADAGLDVPVIPVSSFLRLGATRDESLNAESGFEDLVAHLATTVVRPGVARAASAAAQEVEFVASQLAERTEAERAVLSQPERAPQVIAQLRETTDRAASLAASSSSWQQTLADGIQDLVADVDHDLQERLRHVVRAVEVIIDEGDPKELWPDIEVWLRRQVAQVAVANRSLLINRATELTAEVAGRFELDAGRPFELRLDSPERGVSNLPAIGTLGAQPGRIASMLLATRSSIYVPMVLFSVLSGIWVPIGAAGIAVALGAGIGQKVIKDEIARQRTFRQQQAKGVARKFIDDVAFILNKDTRDALRTTQRRLREDFQARAFSIHLSSRTALEAAERASSLDPDQRSTRTRELVAEEQRVASVRGAARRTAMASGGVAGEDRGAAAVLDRMGHHG